MVPRPPPSGRDRAPLHQLDHRRDLGYRRQVHRPAGQLLQRHPGHPELATHHDDREPLTPPVSRYSRTSRYAVERLIRKIRAASSTVKKSGTSATLNTSIHRLPL